MKKRQISIRILKAAVLISTILAMLPVYVHASYSVGEFSGEFAKGTTIHELWHTMTISHSGKLVLSIRCTGLTFSSVHLVKPDKSSDITYNSSYNLDNISITSDHLAPGTYYIKISYGGVEGTYTIQAVFTDADDNLTESEPNDTIDTAKSFTDNQVTGILGYTDYVSYTDRKDWFKYEVTRSGKLVVNFTCTGAASVSLWKPDKSGEITYKSFVTNASLTSDHLAPGTYYIEVSSVGVYGTYKVQHIILRSAP